VLAGGDQSSRQGEVLMQPRKLPDAVSYQPEAFLA
jgi:hypothetical protein